MENLAYLPRSKYYDENIGWLEHRLSKMQESFLLLLLLVSIAQQPLHGDKLRLGYLKNGDQVLHGWTLAPPAWSWRQAAAEQLSAIMDFLSLLERNVQVIQVGKHTHTHFILNLGLQVKVPADVLFGSSRSPRHQFNLFLLFQMHLASKCFSPTLSWTAG